MKAIKLYGLLVVFGGLALTSCDIEEALEPENEAPQSFELKYPSDNNELVHAIDVTFSWNNAVDNDGSIRTYYFYLGTEATPQFVDSLSGSRYTIDTLQPLTTYYWQVEAIDDQGASVKSDLRTFTTDDPLAGPIPVYPADGAVDVSIPIDFEWDCKNAVIDGYEVYISKAEGGDNIMIPDHGLYSDLEPGTTYYWWVIGIDDSKEQNAEGYYWRGPMAEFTTK